MAVDRLPAAEDFLQGALQIGIEAILAGNATQVSAQRFGLVEGGTAQCGRRKQVDDGGQP
ncbi:MAG: hypothetical protein ABT07_00395 [Microbacterium sp. SCN 70-10]|nr:MAG: hypothetical protein ABT07_00395 [Microbacterium sp. SCN 70-10]